MYQYILVQADDTPSKIISEDFNKENVTKILNKYLSQKKISNIISHSKKLKKLGDELRKTPYEFIEEMDILVTPVTLFNIETDFLERGWCKVRGKILNIFYIIFSDEYNNLSDDEKDISKCMNLYVGIDDSDIDSDMERSYNIDVDSNFNNMDFQIGSEDEEYNEALEQELGIYDEKYSKSPMNSEFICDDKFVNNIDCNAPYLEQNKTTYVEFVK